MITRGGELAAPDGLDYIGNAYLLDALTATLQVAFEAAIFPNRFEIDEQEPNSRLHALTEQLLDRANSISGNGGAEEGDCKLLTIAIISEVARRVRATI